MLRDFNMRLLEHCLTKNAHIPHSLVPLLKTISTHSLDKTVIRPSKMHNYLDLIFCSNILLYKNIPDIPYLGNSDHEGQTFNIFIENL